MPSDTQGYPIRAGILGLPAAACADSSWIPAFAGVTPRFFSCEKSTRQSSGLLGSSPQALDMEHDERHVLLHFPEGGARGQCDHGSP